MSRLILTVPDSRDPDVTLVDVPLGTERSPEHLSRLQRLVDDLRRQGAAPRVFHVPAQDDLSGHRELATDRPLSEQITPGGSFMQRALAEAPSCVSTGDPELIEAMTRHIERYVGPPAYVVHEEASTYVHVDVHVVAPSAKRPCWSVVTSGCAEKPMRAPFGSAWAELMLSLPADWPRERVLGWPVSWLVDLARYPHRCDTWLGYGHTVPFLGGGTVPGSAFTGAMLMKPVTLPNEFHCYRPGGVRHLHVYALYPLTHEETQHKLWRGADDLADLLLQGGVDDVVDLRRPSILRPGAAPRPNRAERRRKKRR